MSDIGIARENVPQTRKTFMSNCRIRVKKKFRNTGSTPENNIAV